MSSSATRPSSPPPPPSSPPDPNHGVRPEYPRDETIIDQLFRHVAASPASPALVVPEGDGDEPGRIELSYAALWSAIDQAADVLTAGRPTGSTQWVIMVLPQGLQQVVGVWGILRAGLGYVPIDAATAAPRLQMLFEECSPCVAIGEHGPTPVANVANACGVALGTFPSGARFGLTLGTASDGGNEAAAPRLPTPETHALLLFSSGSTGTPKGIVYDHRWLMGGSYFVGRDLELTSSSRCLLRCSYVWSVSLYDLFPVNMFGGTLVVPPRGGDMNVQYIGETISREGIHAVVIQPTLLNLLLDEHNASASFPLRSLRHVVTSGEKLFTSTAEAFVRSAGLEASLWNMYGATEAGCTYFVVSGTSDADELRAYPEGVPAGVPQAYVDAFVMLATGDDDGDDPLQPLPSGEIGEICFGDGGAGFMAVGYWRNAALTAKQFVLTKSFGRLYRTGDAGKFEGGQLHVSGRLDRQVKVCSSPRSPLFRIHKLKLRSPLLPLIHRCEACASSRRRSRRD